MCIYIYISCICIYLHTCCSSTYIADYDCTKGCAKNPPVASSQGSSAQWPLSFAACFQVGPLHSPIQTPEHLPRTAEAVDACRSRVFALG